MSVRLSEQVGQSAGEEINRLLHAAHLEAVHDAAIVGVGRQPILPARLTGPESHDRQKSRPACPVTDDAEHTAWLTIIF